VDTAAELRMRSPMMPEIGPKYKPLGNLAACMAAI
jgi:hypothetical protein